MFLSLLRLETPDSRLFQLWLRKISYASMLRSGLLAGVSVRGVVER